MRWHLTINQMKTKILAILFLYVGLLASAQTSTTAIYKIDLANGVIVTKGGKGEFKEYKVRPTTEIVSGNARLKLSDLAVGNSVAVTTGEPGTANRIVVFAANFGIKPAPGQSKIKVLATNVTDKPVIVGTVVAGQKVSITPIKVWWTGGGSKKGKFTDWRGYDPEKAKRAPWMALVATVNGTEFWAKDNSLEFTVPSDGKLELSCNDGDAGGNDGAAEITVTISPK